MLAGEVIDHCNNSIVLEVVDHRNNSVVRVLLGEVVDYRSNSMAKCARRMVGEVKKHCN